jgi:hypothetical protein
MTTQTPEIIDAPNKPTFNQVSEALFITPIKPKIQFSTEFQEKLTLIPATVEKITRVLEADVATLNEEDVELLLAEAKETKAFINDIESLRKALRKYFDDNKAKYQKLIDDKLEESGYRYLMSSEPKITKLRNDVRNNKINERWSELKETFDANIAQYPIISKLAPQLADFSKFRLLKNKLVNGSKTWKFGDKQKKAINETVFEWQKALHFIEENVHGLNMRKQSDLMNAFLNNPTMDNVATASSSLKQQQEMEEQAEKDRVAHQKRIAEQERLQRENTLKQANTAAQATPQSNQTISAPTMTQPAVRPKAVQNHQWLVDYLFAVDSKYQNIHGNDALKSNLLFDMFTHIRDKNSIWYANIGTSAAKVMEIVRYISEL